MAIYNAIYILALSGIFVGFTKNVKLKNAFYIVTSILIVLSVALRSEDMGNDTYRYLEHFLNPSNKAGYYYGRVEFGYLMLVKFLRFIWLNKYAFLFIIAVLPYLAILFFGKKYATNTMLFIFLILSFSIGASLYILSFSMLRQILALGIWAIVLHLYVSNKHKFKWSIIIGIVIMLSFHTSSLLGLVLLAFDKIYLSKKVMIICCLIAYCAGLFMPIIFPYIQNIAIFIGGEFYLTSKISSFTFNSLALLPYIGIFFLILTYSSAQYCNTIFVKGLFISILISGILYSIGTNLDRMNLYFYLPAFIAISNFFSKVKPLIKYMTLSVFIIYFTYKYYYGLEMSYIPFAPLIPYRSFIS